MATHSWQHVNLPSIPAVKLLASWLPQASNWSFIKATVSWVAHLFSRPSQALRAPPNCSRMDDLSGGSGGNGNIPIHQQQILALTKKHKWRHTLGESPYIQKCILWNSGIFVPAEFLRLQHLCQDQLNIQCNDKAREKRLRLLQNLYGTSFVPFNKLFIGILKHPVQQKTFAVEEN